MTAFLRNSLHPKVTLHSKDTSLPLLSVSHGIVISVETCVSSFLVQPHTLIGSCKPRGYNDGSNNTGAWPEGLVSEVPTKHWKTRWFMFSSTPSPS